MICQICQKNVATVHVTEIKDYPVVEKVDDPAPAPSVEQKHICDQCAARGKVPYSSVVSESKSLAMLNMLKESARRVRKEKALKCPDCGMTFAEFRSSGRLGCPRDYEVFKDKLAPLLLRIHNHARHVTAPPGEEPVQHEEREKHLTQLRAKLEEAIQAEAYESAARIRDEIQAIESGAH